MKRPKGEDPDLISSNPVPGINVMVRKRGQLIYAPPHIERKDPKPYISPDEKEAIERESWQWAKEQLKKATGLDDAKAEAEIRKVREAELARKREEGK